MKSRRTKATDIPSTVKEIVYARDNGLCIWCGRPGQPWCHFIARSQGGLGIPENIITGCNECHSAYDQTTQRDMYRQVAKDYLRSKYPDWDETKLVYDKWRFFKEL